MRLSTKKHDRDAAGFLYVYPVVSRRAQGVSIGVNLNPNNACNWRCAYCQVPNLERGASPEIDLDRLRDELTLMLEDVVQGDFMQREVPEGSRRLNDIALSGNGEPTTSKQFDDVLAVIETVLEKIGILGEVRVVLITNGSLIQRDVVQNGLARMARMHGEVWFKLDSATPEGVRRMNDSDLAPERVETNLRRAAELCRTKIQTCVLAYDGEAPSEAEQQAYLDFLERQVQAKVPLHGVLLYGLERQSHQPEAARISKLGPEWLAAFARRIEQTGLEVSVHE
ncbi:MAG: wyosine [tRNA(Phe)-imidazoG37] synthetase (radical SAM superfamily) [Chlamydiales bacterium]|jgi:wyosine [tRNA(Phe)-imidazoG37] synthetase (radical SAM superfamily)